MTVVLADARASVPLLSTIVEATHFVTHGFDQPKMLDFVGDHVDYVGRLLNELPSERLSEAAPFHVAVDATRELVKDTLYSPIEGNEGAYRAAIASVNALWDQPVLREWTTEVRALARERSHASITQIDELASDPARAAELLTQRFEIEMTAEDALGSLASFRARAVELRALAEDDKQLPSRLGEYLATGDASKLPSTHGTWS